MEKTVPKKTILIADDNEDILKLLGFLLLESFDDVDVVSFENTEDALEYVMSNGHKLSLVITDHDIPPYNGINFIKKAKPKLSCPVILHTGRTIILGSELEKLFTFYIHKGNTEELLEKITLLLSPTE